MLKIMSLQVFCFCFTKIISRRSNFEDTSKRVTINSSSKFSSSKVGMPVNELNSWFDVIKFKNFWINFQVVPRYILIVLNKIRFLQLKLWNSNRCHLLRPVSHRVRFLQFCNNVSYRYYFNVFFLLENLHDLHEKSAIDPGRKFWKGTLVFFRRMDPIAIILHNVYIILSICQVKITTNNFF